MIGNFFSFFGKLIDVLMRYLYPAVDMPLEAPKLPPDASSQPIQATPVEPNIAPEMMPMDSESPLILFCTAIRDFEGKPGDRNYKNRNPGNCRFYNGGYLPKYLPVLKDKDGFAIFPTYELGWEYLQNLVKTWVHLHPDWTILDFFNKYAPESDDNPTLRYAKYVASRCGVIHTTKLKDLFV